MHKIFISYSHDSPEHADRVLALADHLIQDGIDCILDQYETSPPEGWPRWMDRHIRDADFVLMICTETYYRRVMGEEKPGTGRGVRWEGNLIYQHLYNADTQNLRFVPVLFEAGDEKFVPAPVQGATFYCLAWPDGYEDLYRRLTNQPKKQKPKLGKLRQLPPRERKQNFFAPKIQTAKLPTTRSELFGREKELQILDAAWADEHTHLVSFVAWGGVGKTALVNEWLSRLERDNFRGAERVFGWSFYSQGTKEERNVSADSFFDEALRWFSSTELAGTAYNGPPILSQWDKGVRLAELIRQQKTLLILDGLEPLQYPPGQMQGELKDQGLKALLKELARANLGLCVVTTRVALKDIVQTEGKSSRRVELENLSAEAGSQLLRHLDVKGTHAELVEAAQEFGGHALALNLLGRYLAVVHAGEIRKRDLIPHLTEEEEQGGHARRVMESYERWLAGKPECSILYLMGLFARPATAGALAALRAAPAIPGLTQELQKLSEAKWQYAVQHLRDLRLLADGIDSARPDGDRAGRGLDCHPLVREHFGEKLRQHNPATWKEAHSRLYEYYKKLPTKHLPNTLEEMEPLFAAVAHGCQAGRHTEAVIDVFYDRIYRRNEKYSVKQLGAFGADLAALSNFFEKPWHQSVTALPDEIKAAVLSWAGHGLRALGRLAEAAKPFQACMETYVDKGDWKWAAMTAGNLSELYLTLGEIPQAVETARQSMDYADRSSDGIRRKTARAQFADAVHQAGDHVVADKLFREAEVIQQQRYCFLYSSIGYRFCDLLLSKGQIVNVLERASQTIKIVKNPLSIALDKLSLGRAHLLQVLGSPNALLRPQPPRREVYNFKPVENFLNQAVTGLRESRHQEYLPLGLLARAAFFRMQNEFALAWADLEEAREIAERAEMKLFLADYHLEACRLVLAEGGGQRAEGLEQRVKEHLAIAKEMIEKMGYGRRKPEVEELQKAIEKL